MFLHIQPPNKIYIFIMSKETFSSRLSKCLAHSPKSSLLTTAKDRATLVRGMFQHIRHEFESISRCCVWKRYKRFKQMLDILTSDTMVTKLRLLTCEVTTTADVPNRRSSRETNRSSTSSDWLNVKTSRCNTLEGMLSLE